MGVVMVSSVRFWVTGVGFAGGSALAAAMIGVGVAPAANATGDDSLGAAASSVSDTALAAASSGNQYDPAVFDYSASPTNFFAPVYTIAPVGPENVEVTTDATGAVYGTQEFSASSLGIPVDTFTGNVEYSPVSSPLDLFGNPYVETIVTSGSPGTLLPETTGFLVTEFGSGYGNVLEEAMNSAGTSTTIGDFLLTPFGDDNITNIVDLFLPQGVGINDPLGAVSAAADGAPVSITTPADLLSDASTNYTDAGQLLSAIPSGSVGEFAPALASATEFDGTMVQGIANLDSAESALSSYGNGVLADILNPVFTNIDQSWDQASEAALSSTQALDGVIDSGSTADIAAGFLAVSTSEFEALQPAIQAGFIDLGAHFLTGGDFTSLADLGAGLDPVSAVDPSMFADLLSSIGL